MLEKEVVFDFFRYQILPKSNNQIDLFERSFTVDELKEKKNEFFWEAINSSGLHFSDSHKNELVYKILDSSSEIMAFKLGRQKEIMLTNEKLEDEAHQDFPSATIVLDNNPERQKIAISQDFDAFSSSFAIANILEEAFGSVLKKYGLEVTINPILNVQDFWKLIQKYQDRITQLKFNLIKPNLANISSTFNKDIRDLAETTNSSTTKVELNAPKDSNLENIDPSNEKLNTLVDYAVQGGTQHIHLKVRGIRRTIKTEKTIEKVAIKAIELSGNPEQVLNTYKRIISEP